MSGAERTVQPDLQYADFFATGIQGFNHFFGGADAGTHQHNHPFGLRIANIFERLIFTASQDGKSIHRINDVLAGGVVIRIGGFAGLEISVRVGGSAADHRMVRRQSTGAMRINLRLRQHLLERVITERGNFVDFVRGPETVEEMNKRHAAVETGNLRNQREILRFLHAGGREQGATGLAYGHHIRMIAKNGQRVGGYGARSDMQHERRQFTGQLVQRRDHQQQTLRRGERGRQCAGLQRAMHGGNRTGFRLHFHYRRDIAPQIFLPFA